MLRSAHRPKARKFYGPVSALEVTYITLLREKHHRGQLMLIERQLSIVPHLTRQFNERVAPMRAARA